VGKFLCYTKDGAVSSMHFHKEKHETFYVFSGKFEFRYIDTETADIKSKILVEGDVVEIPPLCPHQLVCLNVGFIIEFSTTDYA
jgi:quercetin dioxygenase-like cupin family protein